MTPARGLRNRADSERARLSNLARERKVEFQRVLSDFAIERLLYRLGRSHHADFYVLKGAMLFKLWSPSAGRATWDLDLLGRSARGVQDVVGRTGAMNPRRYKPDPEYKDSCIEWLGEIPAHWEVKRLKIVVEFNPPPSEVRDLAPDAEVSFVPMEAVGE
jgi:hypothetical protein